MLLRSVAFLWAVATACKSNLEACFDTWFGGKWLHVANLDFINGHCDEFVLDQDVGKYMDYVAHCCVCISYLFRICISYPFRIYVYSGISGWTTCSPYCDKVSI